MAGTRRVVAGALLPDTRRPSRVRHPTGMRRDAFHHPTPAPVDQTRPDHPRAGLARQCFVFTLLRALAAVGVCSERVRVGGVGLPLEKRPTGPGAANFYATHTSIATPRSQLDSRRCAEHSPPGASAPTTPTVRTCLEPSWVRKPLQEGVCREKEVVKAVVRRVVRIQHRHWCAIRSLGELLQSGAESVSCRLCGQLHRPEQSERRRWSLRELR